MSGTDSVICFKARIGAVIAHFSLIGHNSPTYNASNSAPLYPKGMKGIAAHYDDGVMKCRFERQKLPTKYMAYNLNQKLYLIFARGTVNDKFIKEHKWRDKSWRMVNVSIPLEVEGEEFDLLLAHAGIMFLAWIGFATVGMFTSRYRKSAWGEKKLFNGNIWFRIHQACMLTTVLLILIGVITIFVHVGGWAEGAHPIVGTFTIAFAVSQPIMAFFRPEPQSYSRFLFTWVHRFVGLTAFLLAIINCFLGVNMVNELKVKGTAILSVFLVLLVVLVVLYELFLFRDTKPVLAPFSVDSDGQDHVEITTPADQPVHEEPATPQTHTEKRDSTLRNAAYYFIISLSFLCCLSFLIVLGTLY
ncbi:hypothetical protein QZH41_017614 [Actinostola sp. cb2023]|nr:hypothetical protein QZH41_017614 [Actinostola sp. cb2023]